MRHDRPVAARRIAAAALVVCILVTVVAYAADAPPAPPVWVTAGVADVLPAPAISVPSPSVPESTSESAPEPAPGPTAALVAGATMTGATPTNTTLQSAEPPAAPVAGLPPVAARSVATSGWGFQALGCVTIGALASIGVLVYSNTIAVAVTGGPNPSVLVPMMAAGYAVGCGVGAAVPPGLHWLASHIG